MRFSVLGVVVALLALPAVGSAQDRPFAVTGPYNFRDTYTVNPLGYGAKDVLRIGVTVTHSDVPTSVIATQGANVVTVPIIPAAIEDDKYEIEMPFDPALVGPWTITVTRAGRSIAVETPGVAEAVLLPLLPDIAIDERTNPAELTWTWPSFAGVDLPPGSRLSVELGVTEEDTRDEFILTWGLADRGPIEVGEAGTEYRIAIPEWDLDFNRLYLFRVVISLVGPDGDFIARTRTYDDRFFGVPDRTQAGAP